MRSRLFLCLCLSLLLAAVFASSAFAGTVTLSDFSPGDGQLLTDGGVWPRFHAVSTGEIPASQSLTVDGVPLSLYYEYLETSGHWVDDGCEMVWVPDAWDYRDVWISGYASLADGPHTLAANITDVEGGNATRTWSVTVAQPPSISTPSPSQYATNTTPLIRVPFYDNGGPHSCTVTVAGQTVPMTLVGNEFQGIVPAPLTEGATVTASATVTDPGGLSTNRTWSFTVFTINQMTATLTPAAGSIKPSYVEFACTITSAVPVDYVEWKIDTDPAVRASVYSAGANKYTSTASKWGMADGSHSATVTAFIAGGGSRSFTTTFTVNAAPYIYPSTPGSLTRTNNATGTISAYFSDNPPAQHTVAMKVDGQTVPAVKNGSYISYTPTSPLAAEQTHTVWASVRDAAGNEASTTWVFWIDRYAAMPMNSCTTCHTAHPASHQARDCGPSCHGDHGEGPWCGSCHGGSPHGDFSACEGCHSDKTQYGHEDSWGNKHNSTSEFSRCSQCHTRSLAREHYRHTDAFDVKLTCLTCHGAGASAAVKNAILTNNTTCIACHPRANHEALHVSPTHSTCFGAGCHPATKNLADVHALYAGNGSEHPQYADSCALCHKNPAVNTATSGTACTPNCHPLATHSRANALHTPTAASSTCTGCHGTDLPSVHKAGAADWSRCDLCHVKKDTWSKTADCESCHAAGHPHPAAAITGVQAGDGHLCTECHSTDIVAEHSKSTSAGSADACATCHADGGARSKIAGAWDLSCTTAACHGEASAQPMHSTYCGGCHENENTDFSVRQTNFAAPALNKTKCLACHGTGITNAGSYKVGRRWVSYRHLSHNATDECAGCHYWEPRRTEFYTHTVKGAYGFFASVDSTNPAPARAHSVHVNGSWAAPLEFAPQIYCGNCHKAAGCGSCHEVATMPAAHANHGTQATQTVLAAPGAASYTAPKAALVPETRSCTAAACHGSTATQVPTCTSCHTDRSVKHW